eukprot:2002726-Lingulodinium_polyedra.AAC.1
MLPLMPRRARMPPRHGPTRARARFATGGSASSSAEDLCGKGCERVVCPQRGHAGRMSARQAHL